MNEVALIRQPTACMWCLAGVDYDVSHVIPASCGNDTLILPPPIVCTKCNHGFGKIERAFAAEPEFNFKAALVGVYDARRGRPFSHDRFGILEGLPVRTPGAQWNFVCEMSQRLYNFTQIEVTPSVTLNGNALALHAASVEVTPRWLGLYTRSVYKILFEWYAHHYYVTGKVFDACGPPTDPRFNHVRAFVREGVPQTLHRTVLRTHSGISKAMDWDLDRNSDLFLTQIDLLGTRYVGALLGSNADVKQRLNSYAAQNVEPMPTLIFADTFQANSTNGTSMTATWNV